MFGCVSFGCVVVEIGRLKGGFGGASALVAGVVIIRGFLAAAAGAEEYWRCLVIKLSNDLLVWLFVCDLVVSLLR